MVQTAVYDLFISYSNADRAWVEGYLLDALKQAGVRYHYEAAFALGTARLLEFERAIQQSRRTLLVVSPAYLTNGFNQFIDLLAQSYGMETASWPVIPLILQPVQLPPRLSMLVGLMATTPEEEEEAIERLCAELKRPVPVGSPKPACPYPGMVPFSEANSDRFFGRDREVKELVERLRLHQFIAAIGPSGSGKSSLVFAGLIPALRRSRRFGSGEWLVRTIRPGETPLAALKTVLGSDSANPALAVTEALATQPPAQRLLLVVDQFEEVFTLAGREAVPFQEALLHLLKVPNCYLILTVRADFYPDLMGSPFWQKIQSHRQEVVPLDEGGLREAIIRPAEDVGVFVEAALVERLVTDAAGEPGVLPLIQETLVLLWEQLERRFLPLRAYEALVLTRKAYGALGSDKRTGLQVAIARRADAAIADLSEEQQAIARRIFLRLVQFGEGRADTRRQQSVDALRAAGESSQLFDQTLHHLTDCRLLTLSGEENSHIKVDIAHEALISGWPTLQQWITERREAEQTRRRLAAKAQEWVRLGKASGGLLDEVQLAEAQAWLNSLDVADLGIDPVLPALVEASRRAIQVAKQREEEARQRELEQERKARKAAQRTIQVGLISLAFVTGFAIFAGMQWLETEKQLIVSISKYSKWLSDSNRGFEALIEGIRAGKKLQKVAWAATDTQIQTQTVTALQEAVYGVRERNRLEGHKGTVYSVSFSPDGKTIASVSAEGTIALWNQNGRLLRTLTGHKGTVYDVSFSPDGQTLASASADGTIALWSQDGTLRHTLTEHNGAVHSVSFSPDGKTIASASADGTIALWNQNGGLLKTLTGHQGTVYDVSFSPDSQTLASASADKTIKIWNSDGTLRKTVTGYKKPVLGVSFSPDGQAIAATSEDGTIQFWSKEGKLLKRWFDGNVVHRVIFSPDGKTIASVGGDTTVKLWNPDGTWLQTFQGHTDGVFGVAFSPDGQTIASASADGTVKLWERENMMLRTLLGHNGDVFSGIFSPDGQTIASASSDNTVKLWQRNGTLFKTLKGHSDKVHGISFSPDGRTIASASGDGTIKLWSRDGVLLKTLKGHSGIVYVASFSPDGRTIASASGDGTLKLWSRDGVLLKTLQGHDDVVHGVSFSPDGQTIASASHDQTVKLWNSSDGTLIKTLRGHTNWVHGVSFSPDGRILASASHDRTVKLWSRDGNVLGTIAGHTDKVLGVSFSSDGKMLASSSQDNTVKIWRLDGTAIATLKQSGNTPMAILRGHGNWVNSVSFSPDNKTLASASYDNTVIVWNLENIDNLSPLTMQGCHWVGGYLQHNPNVENSDRRLCD